MTNIERIKALETRVRALELRAADERQLAKITDNPPTVNNAFIIMEALNAMKVLGPKFANDQSQTPEVRQAASEGWNALQQLGMLPW